MRGFRTLISVWFEVGCICNYSYAKISLCLHDSTHFFQPTQRQFCQLENEKEPLFPFPCPLVSPRNPVSVRVFGGGCQGLWCGKNQWLEQCGGVLTDWHVGWCPMLSTSFLVMINDSILSRSSWMRKRLTLEIQVPLRGLVVSRTALEPHGESSWSMCVNRHLTCSSGFKQGTHPCKFLAWRKYKQNSPKWTNKISQ